MRICPTGTAPGAPDPLECPERMLDPLELTGRAATHVVPLPDLDCTLHPVAAEAFQAMARAAGAAGIALGAVSSFRDFDGQVRIWNAKYRGERTLFDADGRELDRSRLDDRGLLDAILMWSALPGASRHHWGTEVDVIDRAALAGGYRPQLLPHEFAPGGVFGRLGRWLEANMGRFGFFRPYATFRGGVRPEPWHLSFAPVSLPALQALTPAVLVEALAASSIDGREQVLGRLPELYTRFVCAIDPPPAALTGPTRPS